MLNDKETIRFTVTDEDAREMQVILNLPDGVFEENRQQIQQLMGRTVTGMSFAASEDSFVREWQAEVASGRTRLGYAEWRDQ